MTDPSWGWNDDSNYNAGYNANQHWQQRQEPWNNQGAYSNQPTTAMPSDKVYNNYYNQQANIPSIPMTANYSQTNQMQSFGMPSQNSYGVGNLPSFSDQFMSEPMLNAAKQIGGQFAVQQKEKASKVNFYDKFQLTKYLSAFHLKYYFAVDNTYVGKKLGLMLFPFLHQDWTVKFTPEQLGIITTNALAYLIFENLIIIITRYIMNISESLTFWHSLAYSSYKFVGMNICLLVFILGGKSFYYWVLAYISFAIVFFLLRTVKTFLMDVQNTYNEYGGKKRKIYLMLFIAFTQPFLIWWLTSSVTSYTPGKMDLAQYALSGIGFKEAVSKGQLPMLPSGEVDYEALLKMP
ncbi:unnamed protein product [Wuchereria bancrofti]|uniref:Protein YIF1 n=1 Tax=Wuchereria bancrofti TaxID=6293 RepID=A0A3P7DYC3_WUCBA|nr:unnamed protein product [Wuchereria bancrofti]